MKYIARVLDLASLTVRSEQVEAQDLATLRIGLAAQGGRLLSAEPMRRRASVATSLPGSARRPTEVALWCRELKGLVEAGLSVVEALEALAEQQDHGAGERTTNVHRLLLERLQQGRPLSGAMVDVGGFPPLLVAAVRSSEQTSEVARALGTFIRFDDQMAALRRRVTSAALYPALVASLGALVTAFLLIVVFPRFAALYGQLGQEAGPVTQALLALSRQLNAMPWLLPGLALLMVSGLILVLRSGDARQGLMRWALSLRVLDRPVRDFELASFHESLALLVRGGIPLHAALMVCEEVTRDFTRVRTGLVREEVEKGRSVAAAMSAAGLTDPIADRLLRAGERGGDFGSVLGSLAARHAQAFETFVERTTRIVEPLLLLFVALIVGSIVLALYMPIFDMASSIR